MSDNANYTPRFKTLFREKGVPALREKFGYENIMQVPRLEKIVLNMGIGEASRDNKLVQIAQDDLGLIAGQKPRRNKARVSVAQFKIRAGTMVVGCNTTLRGNRMYDFLERLIVIAIPRIRDFRGLSPKSFDGRGNYNFGLKEHQIFLELDTTKEIHPFGMDLAFTTSAKTNEECKALLEVFGFPFREA